MYGYIFKRIEWNESSCYGGRELNDVQQESTFLDTSIHYQHFLFITSFFSFLLILWLVRWGKKIYEI